MTPEGGLSLVGDVGVLGKVSSSSSQQGQKQKFFATRSADGKWNLLMAPTSDPSRLFLVQPAPGHKFQVAGGGVRVESVNSGSPSSPEKTSSTSNGCDKEQPVNISSPESVGQSPGSPKSVSVPVAQFLTSSASSVVSSPHTTTASTPINVETTTTASEAAPSCSVPEQKKPTFFKSRSASDREALKAQHMASKNLLSVSKKSGKSSSPTTHSSKKGKNSSKTTGSSKSHKKSAALPTPLQDSMSECFSQMHVSPSPCRASPNTSTPAATSTTTLTGVTTTIMSSVASSTSTSHSSASSPGSSGTCVTPSVGPSLRISPPSSPLHHEASDVLPSTSPCSVDPPPSSPQNKEMCSPLSSSQNKEMSRSRTSSVSDGNCEGMLVPVSEVPGGKDSVEIHQADKLDKDGRTEGTAVGSSFSCENLFTEHEKDQADIIDHNNPCLAVQEQHPAVDEASQNVSDVLHSDEMATDDVDGNGNEEASELEQHATENGKGSSPQKSGSSELIQSTAGECHSPTVASSSHKTSHKKKHRKLKSKCTDSVVEAVDAVTCKKRKLADKETHPNSSDTDDYEFAASDTESESKRHSSSKTSLEDYSTADNASVPGCDLHTVSESDSTSSGRKTSSNKTHTKQRTKNVGKRTPSRKLTRNRDSNADSDIKVTDACVSMSSSEQYAVETKSDVNSDFAVTKESGRTGGEEGVAVPCLRSESERSDRVSSQESDGILAESSAVCRESVLDGDTLPQNQTQTEDGNMSHSNLSRYPGREGKMTEVNSDVDSSRADHVENTVHKPQHKSGIEGEITVYDKVKASLGTDSEQSDRISNQESQSPPIESAQHLSADKSTLSPWMVPNEPQRKQKKGKKKKVSSRPVSEVNMENAELTTVTHTEQSQANNQELNLLSVSIAEQTAPKKKKKRKSELEKLIESQEVESAREAETENTREPETESTREPETDSTREPETESTREPETESTREPETESTREPETESTKKPETESTKKPETESTKEPETESTRETETEGAREPEMESAREPEMERTRELETESAAEPETEIGKKSETENVRVPETREPETENSEAETERAKGPESDINPIQTELANLDTVVEETKELECSSQQVKSPAAEVVSLDSSEQSNIISEQKKHKKKKKKKQKLKIFISLNEAKSEEDVGGQSNTFSTTDSASLTKDKSTVLGDESSQFREVEEEKSEQSISATIEKSHPDQVESPMRTDDPFSAEQESAALVRKAKKKKKKNKKLKIIFGSGLETSTREISVSVSPQSSTWNESDTFLEPVADESSETLTQTVPEAQTVREPVSTTATDPTVSESFLSEPSTEKPKKKRKKRLTELETLIHDNERLAAQELDAAEEAEMSVTDEDVPVPQKEPEVRELGMSEETETNEVGVHEASLTSEPEVGENPANNDNSLSFPSHGILDVVSERRSKKNALHSLNSKVEKPKQKKKKKKKNSAADTITVPLKTSDADTGSTEPMANVTSVMPADLPPVSVEDDSNPDCTTVDSQGEEAASAVSVNTDEEDEEASANRAMAKFLTSRSFTKWELARMFGTPFVVLERLSEQDVYFMSRRFRNARVSSRARCSKHCRMRTLGYLCELKLIECRPPAGSAQTPPSTSLKDSDQQKASEQVPKAPKKNRKRKKTGEEEDVNKKKKKKKSKEPNDKNSSDTHDRADSAKKADSDDVIIIEDSTKEPTTSQASSTSNTPTTSTATSLPSFPSASRGRVPVLRRAIAPNRQGFILAGSQTSSSSAPRVITIPSLAASRASSLPQVIALPSLSANTGTPSLPQVITIPSLSASNSTPTIVLPKSTVSLRDATRASLTQAISNSLLKSRPVIPGAPISPPVTSSSPPLSRTASLLPKGPVVVQGIGTSSTTTTTPSSSSAALAKQFYVVQMGDKRVLVPAAALCNTSTSPSNTVTTSATPATTVTSPAPSAQSVVSVSSVSVQQPTGNIPTVVNSTTTIRPIVPTSVTPGSVARIVLSSRRANSLTPRGPTASSLLFAARGGVARPNLPWTGPRTVESHKRMVVAPASQPQGIRVVLSGAGPVSANTRFSVASSRSGVFVTSRQPTSLVRGVPAGQSRPGKRILTEEERQRKRARLEKKYPLPPGVVIKTEPVTQGYGDEGKTVQAGSSSTRVFVSKYPRALSSNTRFSLNQPIPVLSALRGSPLVIRQATPVSGTVPRASSLLTPLIIRMPNSSAASTSASATLSTTTTTVSGTAVSLLSSLSSQVVTSPVATSNAISLLNAGSSRTVVTSAPAVSTVTVSAVSQPGQPTSMAASVLPHVIVSVAASVTSSVSSSRGVPSSHPQTNQEEDAIYIADSPVQEPEVSREENQSTEVPVTSVPSSSVQSTADSPPAPSSPPATSDVIAVSPATVSATASTTAETSGSPSPCLSTSSSPGPRASTPVLSSRMASLGALWMRQVAESPGSAPSINTSSLQSERMRRLKETLARQMGNVGDERRQRALQALHHRFFKAARSSQQLAGSASPAVTDSLGTRESEDSSVRELDEQLTESVNRREGDEGRQEVAECSVIDWEEEREGASNRGKEQRGEETTETIVIQEDSDDGMADNGGRDLTWPVTVHQETDSNTEVDVTVSRAELGETADMPRGSVTDSSEQDRIEKTNEDDSVELPEVIEDITDRGVQESNNEGNQIVPRSDGGIESTTETSVTVRAREAALEVDGIVRRASETGTDEAPTTDHVTQQGKETERVDVPPTDHSMDTCVQENLSEEQDREKMLPAEQNSASDREDALTVNQDRDTDSSADAGTGGASKDVMSKDDVTDHVTDSTTDDTERDATTTQGTEVEPMPAGNTDDGDKGVSDDAGSTSS